MQSGEQNDVLELALLPGGHYLVAACAPHGRYFWRITLYALDQKVAGALPVAEVRTGTKAYNLRVMYAPWQGEMGIMICYTRRCIRNEEDCFKGSALSFHLTYLRC